jgi:xanthine dehydrogenase YagR molybdenum-binding subunit
MFTWQGHRPPLVQNISLASGPDGRLVMLKHETTAATSPTSHFVAPTGVVSKITYSCPNVHASHKLLPVNRATPTWMRAPAEAPGSFALESAMDELAWALRMDPVELRLQNYAVIDPATGKLFSGKNLRVCYELGVQKFRWHERPAAPRSLTDGKTLVGWGMATASYPGHRRDCSARVRVCADGTATVQSAVHDIGTGAYTVFTQAAADALGLPVGAVKFQLGDSAFPNGPPAGGSVTTASTTEAIARAVGAAQAKLVKLTERIPNSPLHGVPRKSIAAIDGRIVDATHPARGLSYAEILTATGKPWIEAEGTAEEHDPKTKGFTIQSFGAHFCEVRIDPLLAEVKVSQFVSVFDVGRIINPKMARSQAYGGIVMGIGMALMEETVYDPRSGRPVTDSLADYHIPVNADIGTIDVTFVDEPDRHINLLGCRGVGEVPITGAAAAVANAVFHATGRRVRDLPITPDKLL